MRIGVLVAVLLIEGSALADAPTSLRFKIPEGWVDLSSDAPRENFVGLDPALAKAAQSSKLHKTAMDLAHGNDGFVENLTVALAPCPGPFDQKLVDELVTYFPDAVAHEAPGATIQTLSQSLVQIDNVNAGRFENVVVIEGVKIRQLVYVIPGGAECATMTYSTTEQAWPQYLAVFDASAKATTGVATPPQKWDAQKIVTQLMIWAVIALVVLFPRMRAAWKKRHLA